MEETLINHPRLRASRRTGSEGPRHDPYHFEELRVDTPAGSTVLHGGLAEWIKHEGHRMDWYDQDPQKITDVFEKLTGYSVEFIERVARRLASRCRRCGGRDFHEESGYPGETFTVCDGCSDVVGTRFCQSAIE